MKPSPRGHTGFGHREFFQWSRTCPHCAQTRGALSVVAVFFLPAIEPKSYGYAGGGFRSQRQLLPYGRQELHLPAGYRGRYLSGSCDASFEPTRVNLNVTEGIKTVLTELYERARHKQCGGPDRLQNLRGFAGSVERCANPG